MSAPSPSESVDAAVLALAGRARLEFDAGRLRESVEGRSIAVTGAGGSIGTALARHLARSGAATLVLVDRSEHDLFTLERALERDPSNARIAAVLADAGDVGVVGDALRAHAAEIVFHAAAYKHAPMLERFPVAALANNVLASYRLATAARAAGVRRFVAVSTDKAVDPVGVMGATKRAVERVFAATPETAMSIVSARFGNVVGSRGSVVPLFFEALGAGRRVEITDADASRLFLTEAEAVELLVSCVAIGAHGDVLVPDLGAPVRIVDLARAVAEAAGVGASAVELDVVGLRAGERLTESLVSERERAEPTSHPSVRRAVGDAPPSHDEVADWLTRCEAAVAARDALATVRLLEELVPEYRPAGRAREPERVP